MQSDINKTNVMSNAECSYAELNNDKYRECE
jgi:hypothetical protein